MSGGREVCVHHGCIEMVAENERLRSILGKLRPAAQGVWSPSADEHLQYVLYGVRDIDLTDAEAALLDTIKETTP